MLKASKYNHVVEYKGKYILYNFMYKNILELSESEHNRLTNVLKHSEFSNCSSSDVDILRENLFLIEESFDEFDYFKYNYLKSLYSSNIFRNTILPTLSCNLCCPYCYEVKTGSTMSEDTIDSYLEWTKPFLQECKEFYISWFGGEPLLRFDVIENITSKIIKLQNQYHFKYSANIITNGTLLNTNIIKKLPDLHIQSIQVCFDGDKDKHDLYRKHHSGNGSFDTIMQNLEDYCALVNSSTACIIRINVTDDNYDGIESLLNKFSQSVKNKCLVFFHWIYANEATGYKAFSEEKRGKKPFDNLQKLYLLAQSKGFYIHTLDEGLNYNFCECDFANGYIIDPDGDIFMCSHSMSKEESIGNVRSGIKDEAGLARYYSFVNTNPFEDKQCVECKFLPVCKGGCRKARYLGEKMCAENVSDINKYIVLNYLKHNELERR